MHDRFDDLLPVIDTPEDDDAPVFDAPDMDIRDDFDDTLVEDDVFEEMAEPRFVRGLPDYLAQELRLCELDRLNTI